MKVLISGYYGFGNVGDEAVLESILQRFRKRDPEMELTVLSTVPELTAELNKVRSVHRYDWFRVLLEIGKADVLVSGGGTLFQDVTSSRSFWYYLGLVILAKIFRKKAVVFAQGFGPLRRKINRELARFVLNKADLITLRDEGSFEKLREMGVKNPHLHVAADPTAMLEIPDLAEGQRILSLEGIPQDKPLLGVSVRSIPQRPDLEKKVFPLLAETLDYLAGTFNYRPVFTLFQCPEDMRESSKVMASMKKSAHVVFRICRPKEMLALISQCELLIGMRLHSLIFAALSGVPMCGLSYDPKVGEFMKSIGQPFIDIDSPHLDLEKELIKCLDDLRLRKDAVKQELENRKKDLRKKADLNFDLFFKALEVTR